MKPYQRHCTWGERLLTLHSFQETNIDAFAMSFSQEPFPEERSALNIARHGKNSPFRHWKAVEGYIQQLLDRKGYQDLVSYHTTVELVHKDDESGKWVFTLRKPLDSNQDKWWTESFDAVIVAAGHYTVPFIPATAGLPELSHNFPGIVEHSKAWRKPEKYRGKRIIVVGASISGPDIAFALADITETPLNCVVRGRYVRSYICSCLPFAAVLTLSSLLGKNGMLTFASTRTFLTMPFSTQTYVESLLSPRSFRVGRPMSEQFISRMVPSWRMLTTLFLEQDIHGRSLFYQNLLPQSVTTAFQTSTSTCSGAKTHPCVSLAQ